MFPKIDFAIQHFVAAKRLEHKGAPLSQLNCIPGTKEVVVAFDGNRVLDDITKAVQKRDPLATYTTSTPPDTYAECGEYITMVTKTLPEKIPEFKAMFIFDGCGFVPRPEVDTPAPQPPTDLLSLFSGGATVTAGGVHEAIRKRVGPRFFICEDLEGRIVRMIRESVRDTLRAPYLAWSQISALFVPSDQRASEVYGCLELLAFPGIHRVITNIDSERGTFDYVLQHEFLSAARGTKEAISDTDVARAVLLLSRNRQFQIRHLAGESLEGLLGRFPLHDLLAKQSDPARRGLMERNIAALDAPVLTTTNGMQYLSQLYNIEKVSAVYAAFGTQAPAMLYYFIMAGPVMPKPFATFCQKMFADDWPLVDSTSFRKVAESILPLRVQVAFQIFQAIAAKNTTNKPVERDIHWLRQYTRIAGQQAGVPDRRISPIICPPEIHLTYWRVTDEDLEPRDGPDDNIYFSNAIPLAERSTPTPPRYNSLRPTLATVLLRSLDLLGYFTHSTEGNEASGPSVYTQALEQFSCPTLSEFGVLLIELVRTYTLNDLPIQTTPTQKEATPLGQGIRFASRLLSIIPMNVDGPWTGPFDAEIAAFGMNTRLLSTTLRHLTEVIASLMFYNESTSLPLDQLDVVISKLPFSLPTEFNAGFLIQWILTNLHPNMTIDDVTAAFPQLYSPQEDLGALFWFWSMAFGALGTIQREEPQLVDENVLYAAHTRVCDACEILMPNYYNEYLLPLRPQPYYYNQPPMNYGPPYRNYGPPQ